MRQFNKLFIILLIPLLAFSAHKYYISLTKIDFIKEKETIQVTMRFFIDDIERTLGNRYNIDLDLATDQENKRSDFYLEKYISQKFILNINNSLAKTNYLGKEYENDVVFFYLEIPDIKSINSIEIQNRMLFEEFAEQENYIKVNINKSKKTFILTKGYDKKMLKF